MTFVKVKNKESSIPISGLLPGSPVILCRAVCLERQEKKMLTDIRSILCDRMEPEQSVYREMPGKVLDYPITIGNFLQEKNGEDSAEQFAELLEYKSRLKNALENDPEYIRINRISEQLGRWLKRKKNEAGEGFTQEEMALFKQKRKRLQKQKREIRRGKEEELCGIYGYDYREIRTMMYKNTVYFSWFYDLQKMFPQLAKIKTGDIREIPLFVSHLEQLRKALAQKEPIGLVGGPCLFGVDEVFLEMTTDDGERAVFDCSCDRRCLVGNNEKETIEEFIERHPEKIEDVRIRNCKKGVTRQEYDSIRYLFAMGEVFRGKLVIPLPDMSYFKYMENSLEGLETELRENAMQEFKKECYAVTDLYLQIIEQVAAEYPEIEYRVLHHRDESFCKMFYEKRQKYIQGSSYMRKITDKDKKKEAVVDYITMLALPYYVYGTRYVIQVDSVDETDSGRKCNKIHGADMELIQLLYPEYLSSDGRHTIYNTSIEHKNYMV